MVVPRKVRLKQSLRVSNGFGFSVLADSADSRGKCGPLVRSNLVCSVLVDSGLVCANLVCSGLVCSGLERLVVERPIVVERLIIVPFCDSLRLWLRFIRRLSYIAQIAAA